MAQAVPREAVDAFYRAYISRDAQAIGAAVTDDIEWVVNGPAEVMQVCGVWRGKAAVIERFASHIPKIIDFKSLEVESMLVDGDRSAMFGRISCIHRATGRHICHRVAHLAHFRDGKVFALRVLNDSLDAAEQYVGHHISLTADAPAMADDLVAL